MASADAHNMHNLTDSMSTLTLNSHISLPQHEAINTLSELETVLDNTFPGVFWANRIVIFSHTKADIEETLAKHPDTDILLSLRDSLIDIAKEMFSEYANRTPINRKKKPLIITDIYNLGYSIINNNTTHELDNAFQGNISKKNISAPADTDKITDVSRLIKIVTEMQVTIQNNSKEIKTLKDQIKSLQAAKNPSLDTVNPNPQSTNAIIKPPVLCGNSRTHKPPTKTSPITSTNSTVTHNITTTGDNTTEPIAAQHPPNTESNNILVQLPSKPPIPSEYSDSETETIVISPNKCKKKTRPSNLVKVSKPIPAAPKLVKASKPIKAAAAKPEKIIDLFIGNVDKSVTISDMLSHIKSYEIPLESSAILNVPQRSGNKAFKVSLHESYVDFLKTIWDADIVVEEFKIKKKNPINKNPHHFPKKQPFHKNRQQRDFPTKKWVDWRSNDQQRKYPTKKWVNWRANDQAWQGMQQFQFPQRQEFGQYGYPYYYPY